MREPLKHDGWATMPIVCTPTMFIGQTLSVFRLSATSSSCHPLLPCTHHHLVTLQPLLPLLREARLPHNLHKLPLHQHQHRRHCRRHNYHHLYLGDQDRHLHLLHHPYYHPQFCHSQLSHHLKVLPKRNRKSPDLSSRPNQRASLHVLQSHRNIFGGLRLGKELLVKKWLTTSSVQILTISLPKPLWMLRPIRGRSQKHSLAPTGFAGRRRWTARCPLSRRRAHGAQCRARPTRISSARSGYSASSVRPTGASTSIKLDLSLAALRRYTGGIICYFLPCR